MGNIRVYFDDCLSTNISKHSKCLDLKHEFKNNVQLKKGDLFGEFRMGSTIVLIFEAGPDFEFNMLPRSKIYVGESLGHERTHQPQVQNSNLAESVRSR